MESDTTAIELLDRLAKTWAKWIGPSGDREQYKRMSQFAADGAAALRERDTLRAELAAANERAEKAEAERAVALRCSGENAKAWQEAVCDEAVKRTHLLKEIGLTEQQRDALAARVAELEGALSVPPELLTHMLKLGEVEWGSVPARSDEQHVSDFRDTLAITRETFGTVGDVPLDGVYLQGTATVVCHTGTSPNSPMTARIVAGLWNHFLRTQSALSRTPAQSLAACKAAALREAAKECIWCNLTGRYYASKEMLEGMAERLEAEAANGPQ